jgi:hypothetical protein
MHANSLNQLVFGQDYRNTDQPNLIIFLPHNLQMKKEIVVLEPKNKTLS